jgi:hypothetical protein
MFGALGVATLFAARRVTEPLLADVICLAIVAEAVARLIGVAIDGIPGNVHLLNIAAESFPIAILLIRPTPKGQDDGMSNRTNRRDAEQDGDSCLW